MTKEERETLYTSVLLIVGPPPARTNNFSITEHIALMAWRAHAERVIADILGIDPANNALVVQRFHEFIVFIDWGRA